jgi:2-haloacid dehalogenase
LVDHVISVDEVQLAKPRGEVYRHAADVAGVDPSDLALVAAHPWDIQGAAAAGLITAYLNADRPFSSVMRSPDIQAGTLQEIAEAVTSP